MLSAISRLYIEYLDKEVSNFKLAKIMIHEPRKRRVKYAREVVYNEKAKNEKIYDNIRLIMNQLERKQCHICGGNYPDDKHNFEECYSLDTGWDLEQMNIHCRPKLLIGRSKNIGQRDEVLCIKRLLSFDTKQLVSIFGGRARSGIIVRDVNTGVPISIIKKSPSRCKADVIIEFIGTKEIRKISVKSNNGAPYAVLNHTPRSAYVFQQGFLKPYLADLDYVVMRMNKQKYMDESTEDINIEDLKYLLRRHAFALKKVLMYFIFNGSGSGDSKIQSDSILLIDGDDLEFVDCYHDADKMKYIELLYHKIKLSMRNKGMPKKPKKMTRSSKSKYDDRIKKCNVWIYGAKGSLHIRVR